MILDKSRTSCYYEFIHRNKDIFKNKIVLDIGCATCILSLFCAEYAKFVVGIDNADKILNKGKIIIEKNNVNNIFIFQGKLENNNIYIDENNKIYYINKKKDIENYKKINNIQELNILKFDIIISEWMGYFLFYECMIDTILYARDFYLKPDGYIVPNKVQLYVAGYNDIDYINSNIFIWDKPLYNKDLSELKPNCKTFMENAKVMYIDKFNVTTDIINYYTIDLYTYNKNDNLYVEKSFEIPIKPGKKITSLCFYFDCLFEPIHMKQSLLITNGENNENYNTNNIDNYQKQILSTSMFSEKTHWKQILLHLHYSDYNIVNICSSHNEQSNETSHPSLCASIYIAPTNVYSRNINVMLQVKKTKI
uniref:Protein arginine N-methyltransferase 1-like n=1 Tax=Piliocolobus tephrosceles TaxID=591936 RepID=A0A8C9G9V1_9PRIM